MQPLRGLTVVSVEQAIAAPYATRHLADLGARVIKIERPGVGDFARAYDSRVLGESSHFVWTNRNKESVTLDFKQDDGLDALRALIARADVFVQNLAPGAAVRSGLDADTLRRADPSLVVCGISGYGTGGPYDAMKAYDLMVQSEAGLVSVTGSPDEPAKAGISVADIAAGMYAYSTILAALLERERTGAGATLEVSMLEATVEWMGFPLYYAYDRQAPPPRTRAAHATIYPYGPFETRDGQQVLMAVQNEREWASFCTTFLGEAALITRPEFRTNSARNEHRDLLHPIVAARFAELDADKALRALADVPVAHARVNEMAEVWAHPQLEARHRWHDLPTPGGVVPCLAPPGLPGPPRMDPVPALGAHTEPVLRELGYSDGRIADLRANGIV